MSNMLSNKHKNQMIYSYVKICDPPKSIVFMSKIDQSMEVSKHIILETRMVVTIHPIYIPFTKFHYGYEITNKHITRLDRFEQWIDYLQEWHTNIQPQQHFYISQQTQVILGRDYGVCTNIISMRKVWYSNNTCLTKLIVDICLVLSFTIFCCFNFHDL
jgi:hypothetical protein